MADANCGNYSGAELYELPANRSVEAYIESQTHENQVEACEDSRLTLKIWNEGVDWCNRHSDCNTSRKFRKRCSEIDERVVLWSETVNLVCAGL